MAASPIHIVGWFAPTAWVLLWVALLAGTVGLVVLLRTRWADVKPWKKCALLSFWVHVLLACLAATIRIAAGGGPGVGPGSGGPIRVAFIAVETASRTDEPTPPPAGDPVSTEAQDADDEPADAGDKAPVEIEQEARPPLDAPQLLPDQTPLPPQEEKPAEPTTAPVDADEPTAQQDGAPVVAAEPTTSPAPPDQTEDAVAKSDEEDAAAQGVPEGQTAVATASSSMPAVYARRLAADREAMISGAGGSPATERAVRAALAWLAKAQSADGRWEPRRYGAGQERYVLGQDRGGAGARADTGVSGLALLAFLGAGHTHRDGPYAAQVARGFEYLRRAQAADGSLAGDAELFARMYCHSMATFAVCEAYAMTGDQSLAPCARHAVAYSLAAQHPVDGGWRYRVGDTGDTSQLGWQLMALKSAELGGVAIPEVTWTRADRFIRSVRRGAAGGLAAYRPEGPPTRTMTAEALYCRQLLTGRADGGLDRAALAEAIQSLVNEPPSLGAVNLYYWYYGALALHHAQAASEEAAQAWQQWNAAMTRTLVASQNDDGSWPANCLWGGYGGRVYTTALAAMCLESYYRYAPPAGADVARRGDWQSAPAR